MKSLKTFVCLLLHRWLRQALVFIVASARDRDIETILILTAKKDRHGRLHAYTRRPLSKEEVYAESRRIFAMASKNLHDCPATGKCWSCELPGWEPHRGVVLASLN